VIALECNSVRGRKVQQVYCFTEHISLARKAAVLCVLGSILFFVLPGWADDTLMGESGHTVYPIDTEKIRLEYEHVVIKMDGSNDHRIASVDCEFIFENVSKATVKAKVGFPGNEFTDDAPMGLTAPNLMLFTALVDGKEEYVDIRREVLKEDHYEEKDKNDKLIRSTVTTYRNWYTWGVTFPAGKKAHIKNTYSITPSSDSVKWFIEYVLITGANWKGNIDQAIIEVWYPSEQDLKLRIQDIKPTGYKIEGRRIKWDLRNFKPRENINVIERTVR
jgi:hypothetical protein